MNKKIVAKIFGELLGLVITLLVLFYLLPFLPFINDKYYLWVPIAVVCNIVSSFFDIVKFFGSIKFYYLFKSLSLVPDIISTYYLVELLPFNFGVFNIAWLNNYLPYFLYLSILVMIISFFGFVYKSLTVKELNEKNN